MIKFKDRTFSNFIELLQYQIESGRVYENCFPGSNHFYVKLHLEQKFKRKFTHREIKKLLAEEFGANTHQIKKQLWLQRMLAAKFVEAEIRSWIEESKPSLNNPMEYLPILARKIIEAYEDYKKHVRHYGEDI